MTWAKAVYVVRLVTAAFEEKYVISSFCNRIAMRAVTENRLKLLSSLRRALSGTITVKHFGVVCNQNTVIGVKMHKLTSDSLLCSL